MNVEEENDNIFKNIKEDNNNNITKNFQSNNNYQINEDKYKSKEYDEISKENDKKIEQMSKEEILAAQKEIFASIPSDLIQQFKDNVFSQKIKQSLNKQENNILNLENKIKSPNENEDNDKNNSIIKSTNNLNLNSLNNKEKDNKENDEIILFSYDGKIKKENKKQYMMTNPENKEMIDYRYLTFEQLELKNKFFSIEELHSLLASSNSLQISIGVKIIYSILENNYHKTLDIFIDQLDSLLNKLYYLINSTNINVKIESLKCISLIYHDFFYEDYKKFKFNVLSLGSYPSIIILNFANLDKNFQKQKKKCIKSILENGHDNILEYIRL